jgi:hypothetical protein
MKYLCNYIQDDELKEMYVNANSDEQAPIEAQRILDFNKKYYNLDGKLLSCTNISKRFTDYGYQSVEHFLYDFAKYYKISFESVLDKRDTILKIHVDDNMLMKISENISDEMIITLNEFIKIKHTGFYNTLSVTICHNKYKMKAMVTGDGKQQEHHIWDTTGGSSIHNWKGDLDISIEELEQLIEYKRKGIEVCCVCRKPIEGKSHGFFAGTYCDKCFTPEIRRQRDEAYSCLD